MKKTREPFFFQPRSFHGRQTGGFVRKKIRTSNSTYVRPRDFFQRIAYLPRFVGKTCWQRRGGLSVGDKFRKVTVRNYCANDSLGIEILHVI